MGNINPTDRCLPTKEPPQCPLPPPNITSVLKETRAVPAAGRVRRQGATSRAWPSTRRSAKRAKDDPDGFWAEQAESLALVQAVGQGAGVERAARQVVRRRQDQRQRTTASTGTSTGPRKNKAAIIWEGEPGDTRVADLPAAAPRGLQVRQRPEGARRQEGRPRHHLHADGARSWRSPCSPAPASARRTRVIFGGFSRRGRRRPQQRRQGEARHHRRRRLAARQGRAAEGRTSTTRWRSRRRSRSASSSTAATQQVDMKAGPRRVVARADGRRVAPIAPPSRSTANTRSSSSTPRGSTGKPKGVLHTTGRLPARHVADAQVGLRPQGRRHLLVHRRRRLGDRAQLHRLRPARQRRDGRDVRGRPEPPAARTASGRSSRSTASTIFYTAPTAIRAFIKWGDQHGRRSTTCRACACSARVGEPINPEAWMWYHEVIGGGRCPIVDTWWQTETGVDHDLAAARRHRRPSPAAATKPLPGIVADDRRQAGQAGRRRTRAACSSSRKPWPACCARIYGDDERYKAAVLEPSARTSTSPATAPARTRTATSGSWAASTTC